MAYSELVKNFNRIRDYMREFYVYGFKSREQFTKKSLRSYDDERRRIESWLGDYMSFRQTPDGKQLFFSIDSRKTCHNPLFKAWKTKSFTDGDITLFFIVFDILSDHNKSMNIKEIIQEMDEYLLEFPTPRMFDESTVRKKLKEYTLQGILITEKKGKSVYYRKSMDVEMPDEVLIDYFSEVAPCGVIGSFVLDKINEEYDVFDFKHHYITSAMDSEVLYNIFIAIREKRSIKIEIINRKKEGVSEQSVLPVKVLISSQNGRQYLLAYTPSFRRISAFRIDNIAWVKLEEVSEDFEKYQRILKKMLPHMWGVSTQSRSKEKMEYVEFTITYGDDEQYIRQRLEREKRCGAVEHLDSNTSKFSAEVFDASELFPWIRTFICRIKNLHFSNEQLEEQFRADIEEMCYLYGIGGDK